VLLFERGARGAFKSSRRYSSRALVTANTHDLPTLAAFWSGSDLALRRELGVIADDAALTRAREGRAADRHALLRRLNAEGARLSPGCSAAELCAAVYAFLCRSPAPLVGVSVDDLAGETEPVNVPGVGPERFPSWTRRMGRPLEALRTLSGLSGVAARRLASPNRRVRPDSRGRAP